MPRAGTAPISAHDLTPAYDLTPRPGSLLDGGGLGGSGTPPGCGGLWVTGSGGVAALHHRLQADIPP